MQLLVACVCCLAIFEAFNHFAVIDLVGNAILVNCILATIQDTEAIDQRLVTIRKATDDFCSNVWI